MSQKKYFFFNGQKYSTKGNLKISDLLTYFNFSVSNSTFILEYNKFIYPELAWNETFLQNNDKIELISIVWGE